MFTTAITLYLVAVHGLGLTAPILFAAVLIDLVAWGSLGKMGGPSVEDEKT